MNILHICSGYAQQSLYDELITRLEHSGGIEQFVYVPVRSEREVDGNRNALLARTRFRFAHILRSYHRVLFGRKISTVFRDLTSAVDARGFSVAHAHFLYSDGAVALKLRRELGLPYIVTVRNTDLNYFMRYRPDLMSKCRQVLDQASAVVFVSPAYRDTLLERMPECDRASLRGKSHVVPNGVAAFWLQHSPEHLLRGQSPVRLLYVGDFSRNKNVPTTIRAAEIVARKLDTRLTLVGGGGNGARAVSKMLASNRYRWASFAGKIDRREELLAVYRQHDILVMPSITETFGLAYVEALSQGLPVVYSRGQGVDGYFDKGTVAEASDPHDPSSVATSIHALTDRLPEIRQQCIEQATRFDWTQIAKIYIDLYENTSERA